MSEEQVIAAGAPGVVADETPEVNPEVSEPADTAKVGEEQEPQGAQNEGEKEPENPKRKGGWQRRIERLEQENEYWRNAALSAHKAPEPQPQAKAEEELAEPNPEDFDTVAAYLKARDAYTDKVIDRKVAKILEQRETQVKAKTAEQKALESFAQQIEDAREEFEDFDDVVVAPKIIPISKALQELIRKDDSGARLAYHLCKHPDEGERISRLHESDPFAAAVALGTLKARIAKIESAEAKPEKPAPLPPVTKATPPPTPVKKTVPVSKPFDPNDEDQAKSLSAEEWAEKRYAWLRKKGAE